MGTVQKGTRKERELRQLFEAAGWFVDFKHRSRWQSPDLLGLFDFVAVKGGMVRWVQVKSDRSDYYKARKAIKGWLVDNGLDIWCEVWCRGDREDWYGSEVSSQGYTEATL